MLFFHSKDPILAEMQKTLHLLKSSDVATLKRLDSEWANAAVVLSLEQKRELAIAEVEKAIAFAKDEPSPDGHTFHSRDPLTGLFQSVVSAAGDSVIPEMQAYGEGNPVVWIPTGLDAIFEHFKEKAPFQIATAKSQIPLPAKCKIALLSDWGADNEHARRLGELAIAKGADFVIHLGDIYYSGARQECELFLKNWPLKGTDGTPVVGKSFALNGNHEMYSLGWHYFGTVLKGFGQEASYFTLLNDWWQFFGLDTAYLPYSISGGEADKNLLPQWTWLLEGMQAGKHKKNVILSHNQPISAHLAEFEASYPLNQEYRRLLSQTNANAIFAWFFGHEHRCAIYDDSKTDFKARLIGNGAIPHHPQEETTADKDETGTSATPFLKINKGTIGDGALAISTFVLLTLDEAKAHVEYINEDGSLFYEEEW